MSVAGVRVVEFGTNGFSPTFVASASWDKDELIRFWGSKGQGPSMTQYAKTVYKTQPAEAYTELDAVASEF